MPQELRSDILAFYRDLDAPISTRSDHGEWARVLEELDRLRSVDADVHHPVVAVAEAPLPR